MQSLARHHGSAVIEAALRHLSIRLRAASGTAALAADVDAARAAAATAHEAWQAAVEERVALTAEIASLDAGLHATVAALAREALVTVAGNRRDARYVRLFPTAPTVAMGGVAHEKELLFVRGVLDVLADDPGWSALAAHWDTIGGALTCVMAAQARREAARLPELRAASDRTAAMREARHVYNRTYLRLQLLLPDEAAQIESFFKVLSSPSSAPGVTPPQ